MRTSPRALRPVFPLQGSLGLLEGSLGEKVGAEPGSFLTAGAGHQGTLATASEQERASSSRNRQHRPGSI